MFLNACEIFSSAMHINKFTYTVSRIRLSMLKIKNHIFLSTKCHRILILVSKQDWNSSDLMYLDFSSNSFLNSTSAYWTFSQRHCACRTWCNMTARGKDYSNPYIHTYFTHKSIVFGFQISRQVVFETRAIRIRFSV